MDHYAALGLGHDASSETIRSAYRRLAKAYHPDVSSLPDAHQRFIRITEAYEVLSDPVERSRYDMTRHSPSPRRAAPREERRYERDVRRYQQQAKERAEHFSRMSYTDFDHQYFDTAVGYFAPKMLGCFGMIIAFLLCIALVFGAVKAFDLPLGIISISMLVLIPLGVWASNEIDALHNRWMCERKTRRWNGRQPILGQDVYIMLIPDGMRIQVLIAFTIHAVTAIAQCGPYIGHPIWPDNVGTAFVNQNECGDGITACLWDNGSTAWQASGLSVGMHSVVLYATGVEVQTLLFEVEQLQWELNEAVFPYLGALSVSMWAEVPYCGTSIFNFHRCPPDPEQTEVYLLQDGVAIDSLSPVGCLATQHEWSGLPFGYSYQLHLVDHGACGSEAWGAALETWSCAGADVMLDVQPSMGSTGTIEVMEVMPDPASINPPTGPLEGTFRLWSLPGYEQVGDLQTGTSAYWDGLPPGDFEVLFAPDLLCDPVITPVTVDLISGIGTRATGPLRVWPQPAENVLYWNGNAKNARIMDLHGRILLQVQNSHQMDVSALASGIYLLHVEGRTAARFVKE